MIPNSNDKLSINTHAELHPKNSIMDIQPIQQHTLYDYLTLLPGLIVAITPLILGLRGKENFSGVKKNPK
jgi:hypothetical protein